MQPQLLRPPVVQGFGTLPYTEAPSAKPVQWGPAIAFGLGAAFLGAFVWAIVAVYVGYIFMWGGVLVGAFVGWAMYKGAGRASGGLVAAAALVTLLAVFVGDVIAWSIVGAEYGYTPLDVLRLYPRLLAAAPGDAAITYIFGAFGVAVAAYTVSKRMGEEKRRGSLAYAGPPAYVGGGFPAPFGAPIAAFEPPVVENLSRPGAASVRLRTRTEPEHVLDATYETESRLASVTLDGMPYANAAVRAPWVSTARVGENPPQIVSFRFYGIRATIDATVDGRPVSRVFDGDPSGTPARTAPVTRPAAPEKPAAAPPEGPGGEDENSEGQTGGAP